MIYVIHTTFPTSTWSPYLKLLHPSCPFAKALIHLAWSLTNKASQVQPLPCRGGLMDVAPQELANMAWDLGRLRNKSSFGPQKEWEDECWCFFVLMNLFSISQYVCLLACFYWVSSVLDKDRCICLMNRARIPFVLFQTEGKTDIGYTDSQVFSAHIGIPYESYGRKCPIKQLWFCTGFNCGDESCDEMVGIAFLMLEKVSEWQKNISIRNARTIHDTWHGFFVRNPMLSIGEVCVLSQIQ